MKTISARSPEGPNPTKGTNTVMIKRMLRVTGTVRLAASTCSICKHHLISSFSNLTGKVFSDSCGHEDIEKVDNGGLSVAASASRVVPCFYMSTAFYTPLFMSILVQ